MTRVIEIGDRATGVPVLRELYEKMNASPAPVDLGALWKELGVEQRNERGRVQRLRTVGFGSESYYAFA